MADNAKTLMTIPTRKNQTLAIGGREYEMVAQVTRPVLSQKGNEPFAVQFEGPIRQSDVRIPDSDMAPPMVADVVNLETGECMLLIVNTVMESELTRYFPDGGYVGKFLAMRREKSAADKRYYTYKIVELRPKADRSADVVQTIDNGEAAVDKVKADRVKHKAA